MKVGIVSLGCSKNLVDTEMVLGQLTKFNFEIVNSAKDAELIIINTCSFINEAKQEAISTIFEMLSYKQEDPKKKIVVMGCLSQRYKKELEVEIPEVDRFISIDEYSKFGDIIASLTTQEISGGLNYFNRYLTTKPFTAYVKIGEGCNNRCSYCAIPLIRGSFKSRPYDELIEETKQIVASGVKEVNYISQDTSRYGTDLTSDRSSLLPKLLTESANLEGVELVRALYLYPDEIDDELIDAMISNPKIAPYFDIPIQHASSKVLKAMYRRGNKAMIKDIVNKIRNKAPHAVIRTTVIVGFPGETEDDFEELLDFIKTVQFDRLGAFAYSMEEGTPAYDFDNQIDKKIKQERLEKIMAAQKIVSYQLNQKRIGQIHKGFVEGYNTKMKMYQVRSYAFAPDDVDGYLYVESEEPLKTGSMVTVKITNAYIHDLIGIII
jgi:ribosomal protein S12 methylthiotransferase